MSHIRESSDPSHRKKDAMCTVLFRICVTAPVTSTIQLVNNMAPCWLSSLSHVSELANKPCQVHWTPSGGLGVLKLTKKIFKLGQWHFGPFGTAACSINSCQRRRRRESRANKMVDAAAAAPLLTHYKMGRFELSHRFASCSPILFFFSLYGNPNLHQESIL
jgi:hypothetical protein